MIGLDPGQVLDLLVRHRRLLRGQKPLHVKGSRHRHDLLRRKALRHGVRQLSSHIGFPDHRLRPVRVLSGSHIPQLPAKGVRPLMVSAAHMLHGALPKGLMPVLSRLPVQKRIDVHAPLLTLDVNAPLLPFREAQEHVRGKIHEPAGSLVLPAPQKRLILRRILRKGIENGADGRLLCVCKDGDGRLCLPPGEIFHLIVQVARSLHQHQPGLLFVQKPAQVPRAGRGQMPDSVYIRLIHAAPPLFVQLLARLI